MKYLLTFKVELDAFDDLEARERSNEIVELSKVTELKEYCQYISLIEKRLQELVTNSPPRKIEL